MLFNFSLRPLQEVSRDSQRLSWFFLTEGFYRLEVGSNYLFNYADNYANHCLQNMPASWKKPLVDYYVVRLWEDILDILPDVLEPIPADLCRFLEMDCDDWSNWVGKALDWEEAQIESGYDQDNAFAIFEMAIEFRRSRYLPGAYLQNSPTTWLWSTDSTVNISWDNQGIVDQGFAVWSAIRGNYSLSRQEFSDEVQSFHQRLFLEMDQRIEFICNHENYSEIPIDIEYLHYEQKDRSLWLDHALAKKSRFNNWRDVRAAVSLIQEYKN